MKKGYRILNLIVLSLSLIGCMNNPKDKNVKDYFFNIEWFDKPLVYEYEYTTSDTKYNTYYAYKKIKTNEVEISVINNDFDTVSTFYYLYKPDGVFINGVTNIDLKNNKKIIKENVLDSLVFPYQFSNNQFSFSTTCEPKNNSTMTRIVSRELKDFGTVNFNGKNISTLITGGKTKLIMKSKESSDQNWAVVTKKNIIYGNGYGVISHDTENQYQVIHKKLKRIVSVEEFKKIMNSN